MVARNRGVIEMASRAGGGIKSNKVVHRPHGKTEPRSNAYNPGGVAQWGQSQGSHVTHEKESSYRGDPKRAGRGYEAPGMISDPLKAVGVGGGRTIYKCGTQAQQGAVNPGNPPANRQRDPLDNK
jgi:hypothetical protein